MNADFTTADLMQFYNFTDFPVDINFILHLNEKTSAGVRSRVKSFGSSPLCCGFRKFFIRPDL